MCSLNLIPNFEYSNKTKFKYLNCLQNYYQSTINYLKGKIEAIKCEKAGFESNAKEGSNICVMKQRTKTH